MEIAFSIFMGFLLDFLFGEPKLLMHPVVMIGKCIAFFEKTLRRVFPESARGEKAAGFILAAVLPIGTYVIMASILFVCYKINPYFMLCVQTFICFRIFAAKSLKTESMAVYHELIKGDIYRAREAIGRIVGRDTTCLNSAEIARAAVETIAENTADGIIAPLLFMAIGGAPLGLAYKAINTMDSMVAYKNDKYINFGYAAAKLDDIANFIPSRIAAAAMIISSFLGGCNGTGALKIFRRDRFNHASPNSAQTEAVMAGALDIQLGGDAYYFGKLKHKPTMGDRIREIQPIDILKANKLMYLTSIICLFVAVAIRILIAYGGR